MSENLTKISETGKEPNPGLKIPDGYLDIPLFKTKPDIEQDESTQEPSKSIHDIVNDIPVYFEDDPLDAIKESMIKSLVLLEISLTKFMLENGYDACFRYEGPLPLPEWLEKELIKLIEFAEDHDANLEIIIKGKQDETKEKTLDDYIQRFTGRNDALNGSEHPNSGIPFIEKEITNEKGEKEKHLFPVFDSAFDLQLPEKLYKATDAEQNAECNRQLKEAVKNDPELAKKFTDKQLEQIERGEKPAGYTWHHNEDTGKMQLVDTKTHAATGHLGGKAIWGGGSDFRNKQTGDNNE